MTVELLQTLRTIAYVLTGLFFVISIVLYFTLKVPKLYSDLTGRTEKKAIAAIRQQNEAMMEDAAGNTDQISSSGKLIPQSTKKEKKQADKGIRYGNVVEKPGHSWQSATATTPLPGYGNDEDSNATTLLNVTNETTVLSPEYNETVVLSGNATTDETTVLPGNIALTEPVRTNQMIAPMPGATAPTVVVEVDLFFAESKEIIQ